MVQENLERRVEDLKSRATPAFLEGAMRTLLHEGEDVGGGINATRLVKHLLDDPQMKDEEVVWAYDRLKSAFRTAFEELPSLYYFEGD